MLRDISHVSLKSSFQTLCLPTAPPTRAFTPRAIPSMNSSGPWMAPWKTPDISSTERKHKDTLNRLYGWGSWQAVNVYH